MNRLESIFGRREGEQPHVIVEMALRSVHFEDPAEQRRVLKRMSDIAALRGVTAMQTTDGYDGTPFPEVIVEQIVSEGLFGDTPLICNIKTRRLNPDELHRRVNWLMERGVKGFFLMTGDKKAGDPDEEYGVLDALRDLRSWGLGDFTVAAAYNPFADIRARDAELKKAVAKAQFCNYFCTQVGFEDEVLKGALAAEDCPPVPMFASLLRMHDDNVKMLGSDKGLAGIRFPGSVGRAYSESGEDKKARRLWALQYLAEQAKVALEAGAEGVYMSEMYNAANVKRFLEHLGVEQE